MPRQLFTHCLPAFRQAGHGGRGAGVVQAYGQAGGPLLALLPELEGEILLAAAGRHITVQPLQRHVQAQAASCFFSVHRLFGQRPADQGPHAQVAVFRAAAQQQHLAGFRLLYRDGQGR